MSHLLPELTSAWAVDQAIMSEEERLVILRFGHKWDPTCMVVDQVIYSIANEVAHLAKIFLVDLSEVPDFKQNWELYDPCTLMFFYQNKMVMLDLGVGVSNKLNFAVEDREEMASIVRDVHDEVKRAPLIKSTGFVGTTAFVLKGRSRVR